MAKPEHRTARKDYPDAGIKKGDKYWFVQIKTGPRSSRTLRQLKPFRRAQLTSSPFLQGLYDFEDSIAAVDDMEEVEQLAATIRELGDEEGEKYDNMPEGLQQGETGQMLEQRRDACHAAADELDDIVSRWQNAQEEIEEWEDYLRRVREGDAGPGDEGEDEDAPDEPEYTLDDLLDEAKSVSVNL